MGKEYSAESFSIGLDDTSWSAMSSDQAQSLLRLCALPDVRDRTYSSVAMLATPNGASLYVKSNLFG
jgi:hypothetical protein